MPTCWKTKDNTLSFTGLKYVSQKEKQTKKQEKQLNREGKRTDSSKFKLRKKNKHRITLSFNGSEQNCFILLRHNSSLNLLDEKVCYNSQESWSLEEAIEMKVV